MTSYRLPLNKAALVFFPPQSEKMLRNGSISQPSVVQVMVKQNCKSSSVDFVAFIRAQEDITTAIERLLMAHIISPLPARVTLDGNGYSLYGERKIWKYGKNLHLLWGDQPVRPCEDKWTFIFVER